MNPGEGLPTSLYLFLKGAAEAALYCAHRTSTVSSCAFCEHRRSTDHHPSPLTTPTPTDAHTFPATHPLRLVPSSRRCRGGRIFRRSTAGHIGTKPFQ